MPRSSMVAGADSAFSSCWASFSAAIAVAQDLVRRASVGLRVPREDAARRFEQGARREDRGRRLDDLVVAGDGLVEAALADAFHPRRGFELVAGVGVEVLLVGESERAGGDPFGVAGLDEPGVFGCERHGAQPGEQVLVGASGCG